MPMFMTFTNVSAQGLITGSCTIRPGAKRQYYVVSCICLSLVLVARSTVAAAAAAVDIVLLKCLYSQLCV